jgi:DNA helicase-2/ATP-dependent DNA helicase PcrA
LEEIPEELVERLDSDRDRDLDQDRDQDSDRDRDYFDQREWRKYQPRTKNQEPWPPQGRPRTSQRANGYPIGAKVKHPDFGVGTVAASEKTSLGEKVTVKFSNGMIKKLIAEYAHLEKI